MMRSLVGLSLVVLALAGCRKESEGAASLAPPPAGDALVQGTQIGKTRDDGTTATVTRAQSGVIGARKWKVASIDRDEGTLTVKVVFLNDALMPSPASTVKWLLRTEGGEDVAPKAVTFEPALVDHTLPPSAQLEVSLTFPAPGTELQRSAVHVESDGHQLDLSLGG